MATVFLTVVITCNSLYTGVSISIGNSSRAIYSLIYVSVIVFSIVDVICYSGSICCSLLEDECTINPLVS